MGLGTACKEETSKVKNISIESSEGGKHYGIWMRKTIYLEKIPLTTTTVSIIIITVN
jgi:hypothetical protein